MGTRPSRRLGGSPRRPSLTKPSQVSHELTRLEAQLEVSGLYVWYDSDVRAHALLSDACSTPSTSQSLRQVSRVVQAELDLRQGRTADARVALEALAGESFYSTTAQKSRVKAMLATAASRDWRP